MKKLQSLITEAVVSLASIKGKLMSRFNEDREEAARSPYLQEEDITTLVTDPNSSVREVIAQHPYLEQHHLQTLAADPDQYVRRAVAAHPRLSADIISGMIHDPDPRITAKISEHPHLSSEHLRALYQWAKGASGFSRNEVINNICNHDKLTSEHVGEIIDQEPEWSSELMNRKDVHPEHITKMLNHEQVSVRTLYKAATKQKLSPEQIDRVIHATRYIDNSRGPIRTQRDIFTSLADKQTLQPHQVKTLMNCGDKFARNILRTKYDVDNSFERLQ